MILLGFKRIWRQLTFANCVISIGVITALIYIFSYLFPITDNAFVVDNVSPVAAQVSGYITNLYVKNGETVHKGQKLFTVFDQPYRYQVEQLTAEVAAAQAKLAGLAQTLARDQQLAKQQQAIYRKLAEDDEKYHQAYAIHAVSLMTLQHSQQETKAAAANYQAAQQQLAIDQQAITSQAHEVTALKAKLKTAQVSLSQTTVYAEKDGIIQNLFLSIGTPVTVNQPLFSFVDTSETYIQANFNETDLRHVRQGAKVLIFPRIYLGEKVFHGVVNADYWAANRQQTDPHTQLQNVSNENQWVLLPQRLPVQIKILDLDPNYPLRVGSSAYVYIKAR